MPHGSLTLLGRQLRSVLANLRTETHITQRTRNTPRLFSATHATRIHNVCGPLQATAAAIASAIEEELEEDADLYRPFDSNVVEGTTLRQPEPDQKEALWPPRESRRPRVQRLSEDASLAQERNGTLRISRERLRPQPDDTNYHWSRNDYSSTPRQSQNHTTSYISAANELNLERILESYIQHQATASGAGNAEWMVPPFELRPWEQELLDSRGYVLNNIKGWTHILTTPDSFEAATKLKDLRNKFGPRSVPLFVVSHLLRRQYISARTMRTLLRLAWSVVQFHNSAERHNRLVDDELFALFVRLLRHARAVWPSAIGTLPELLLQQLPHNAPLEESHAEYVPFSGMLSEEQIDSLTHKLNRAMRLIAVPTSVEPFRSNAFQEAAIVRILRFMAEHNPPLGINRDGYRAVIMIQLAQKKSPTDQQWAELKALSWPPWKEERTAMDADITVEQHGTTKAAETLERMREAGYGPREWEKVASIYTGWDTDQTPTVQTRVSFGFTKDRFASGAAIWTARIETTRTVQEAWACYLAYEDENLPPDQDVFLAVFRKLYENDLRLKGDKKYKIEKGSESKEKTWPGDTREIEPLPPSTHLHTYTRTLPPTLDEFYGKLRERGVLFEDRCLAFLIAKAGSLRQGLKYVYDSVSRYPNMRGLVPSESEYDLSELPNPVFSAFLELLGRFSKVPLPSALPFELKYPLRPSVTTQLIKKQKHNPLNFNSDHALVHAIELLKRRKPLYRSAWNAVFRSLGHESSFLSLTYAFYHMSASHEFEPLTTEQDTWRGTVTAYRLVRRVLSLMREIHLDPDIVGFQALCQAAENLTWGCWMLMLDEARKGERAISVRPKLYLKEATDVVRTLKGHVTRLKGEFRILVGEDEDISTEPDRKGLQLPRLLEVPGPALLHSYLRALGWMADYQGLVETVRWMVKYQSELAERRGRDRNGELMMRRVIIALRVFLERSWLVTPEGQEEVSDADLEDRSVRARLAKQLHKLEAPADESVVNEVRVLVEGVKDWGGWATDDEVESYCEHSRFRQFV